MINKGLANDRNGRAFHNKMKLVLNDMQISNITQSLQENYHGLLPNFDV